MSNHKHRLLRWRLKADNTVSLVKLSPSTQPICSYPWAWAYITQTCSVTLSWALAPWVVSMELSVYLPVWLHLHQYVSSHFLKFLSPVGSALFLKAIQSSLSSVFLWILTAYWYKHSIFISHLQVLPDNRRPEKLWGHRRHQGMLLLRLASCVVCLFFLLLWVFVRSVTHKGGLHFLAIQF